VDATKKKVSECNKDDSIVVFWFRRDLRLSDHPGLSSLCKQGCSIVPLFLFSEKEDSPLSQGGAAKWWLKQSLKELDGLLDGKLILGNVDDFSDSLAQKAAGYQTTIQSRQICSALLELCQHLGSKTVAVTESLFSSRLSAPNPKAGRPSVLNERECFDWEIKEILSAHDIDLIIFPDSHLISPGGLKKDDGSPYQVFTPFYKKFLATNPGQDFRSSFQRSNANWVGLEVFKQNSLPHNLFHSVKNCHWVQSSPFWADKFSASWIPGSVQAEKLVRLFAKERAEGYSQNRDFPSVGGTSLLSPYLAFGEVSPRQVWCQVAENQPANKIPPDRLSFLRQLVWRLFSRETIRAFPRMVEKGFQEKYDRFPWANDPQHLAKWQKGETGVPIVDAAMRQLWETGWMHNRLRMVVGSFLVKNLQVHWSYGEKWFWDTLVDADLSNNVFGWQWVAGCGLDAAPFFRIFNPLTQSRKFDPEGTFLRKFLPELKDCDRKEIHDPLGLLEQSSARKKASRLFPLSVDYPEPIVCLKETRADTLAKFRSLNES